MAAVLFDMDGTLVDSEPVHGRALADVLAGLQLTVPEGFAEAMTGQSIQALHAALREQHASLPALAEFSTAKARAVIARRSELHWRPGAQAAWDSAALRARAIVSNSERMVLQTCIQRLGLETADRVSVARNEVRHGKPDPEPYLRAAWLLQVEPQHCVVIEDSPTGALAGLAAGMQVVAWPEPHRRAIPFPDTVQLCLVEQLGPWLVQHCLNRG